MESTPNSPSLVLKDGMLTLILRGVPIDLQSGPLHIKTPGKPRSPETIIRFGGQDLAPYLKSLRYTMKAGESDQIELEMITRDY